MGTNKGKFIGYLLHSSFIPYLVIIGIILGLRPELWWRCLLAFILTELTVRIYINVLVDKFLVDYEMLSPVYRIFPSLYHQYQTTSDYLFITWFRRLRPVYVWRWILFSALINLFTLPQSPLLGYLELMSPDKFIDEQMGDKGYPLGVTLYAILWVPYILFAIIADIVILAFNATVIAFLPNIQSVLILSKMRTQFKLPPKPKKVKYKK